ncbi:radial spoke head 1 homolog [Actinia tenebrosa]|uniref:Radial spoke head 1 homolog n=1 Tax=Actinia tenebrosa TaxID=6105 RepID=A0A6P8IEN9_ACTTE|nr:radial spoke head 1 homolog [Actinia tenebrosa]
MSDLHFDSDEEGDREYDLGEYEGQRNELGERHGVGKAVLPNGDIYKGSYHNGKRNGQGSYFFRRGAKYTGTYDNNKKQGRGTFVYPDGSKYEGMWVDDERNGQGLYTYPNNDVYDGEWKKNKKHGRGSYLCAKTKVKLEGTWVRGKLNGTGKMILADHVYQGKFADNLPSGPGKYVFKKGFEQYGVYNIKEKKKRQFDEEEEPIRTPIWKCIGLSQTL